LRLYDPDTDDANIAHHYYYQDANFNVTAVASGSSVVERYSYTPYGEVTFLEEEEQRGQNYFPKK
jgi:hypothetical protein